MAFVKKPPSEPSGMDKRKHPRDLAGLVAQLEDPEPGSRRWAARDLADHPSASASVALVARLGRESNRAVREAIFATLTSIGDDVALAGLVACLRSEDVALRNEAIEAMQQLPQAVAPVMAVLLADPGPDVRIFAVNILESLRHPDVESWLIGVIERDAHVNVCATALDLLGEVGSAAAREPLTRLKARFSDEPYIQFGCDLALQRLAGDLERG